MLGRTRRYPLSRVARLSGLAGVAHVLVSIGLGAVIIVVGLQFRSSIDSAKDAIVGGLLLATGSRSSWSSSPVGGTRTLTLTRISTDATTSTDATITTEATISMGTRGSGGSTAWLPWSFRSARQRRPT